MKKTAVFFADGFEEVEALTQVDLLRRAGIKVDMVSIVENKKVKGAHQIEVMCEKYIEEVKNEKYDALVLPGGMPGTINLVNCETLVDMILKQNEEGRIVSAICAAPSVLGKLGVLSGKKACAYPGFENELKGAEVVVEKVAVDGNVITSRGVGTAIEFASAIITALIDSKKAKEVKEEIIYSF